jgi:hypothetical protein
MPNTDDTTGTSISRGAQRRYELHDLELAAADFQSWAGKYKRPEDENAQFCQAEYERLRRRIAALLSEGPCGAAALAAPVKCETL